MTSPLEPHALPDRIETGRLFLKKHDLSLAADMFRYVDEDRARLRAFLPWVDFIRTEADEAAYITDALRKWETYELFDYGVFRRADGVYLGNVGAHNLAWKHGRCELGYWILGAFEDQGFMSEAVGALESTVFAAGFHRIEIRCSSANHRSALVPIRRGFKLDGVLRANSIEHGAYRDTRVYAKLAPDFRAEATPEKFVPRTVQARDGQTFTLRAARPGDAIRLLEFKGVVMREDEFTMTQVHERAESPTEEAEWIESHRRHPDHLLLIAEHAGEIVGMLDFSSGHRERIAHTGNFGISIAKTHREIGLGPTMLAAFLDWARMRPLRNINLMVHATNARAIHVYRKLGFVEEGRKRNDLRYGDRFVDTVLMSYDLKGVSP